MNRWAIITAIGRACLKKEGIVFLAMCVLTAGCGVLSGLLGWTIFILQGANKTDEIAFLAYGLLGTLAIGFLSLHKLLAGKQAIQAELWKLKFNVTQDSGGSDE